MKTWQEIQQDYVDSNYEANLQAYESHLYWWKIYHPEDSPNCIRKPLKPENYKSS